MKTTGTAYSIDDSDNRIREILDAGDQSFEELDSIPSSDKLTYTNGFYVYCTALFIDIRGSSKLPQTHNRPVLGKIYRAYISECVAILNQDPNCREVFINGDCVTGIFDTPKKPDVEAVFFRAGQLNALLKLLNWRLEQKGYAQIQCGIGIDYGRALMLKAGYKGSSINEVIWMGDVVNNASNLCHQGNKGDRKAVQVSPTIKSNLTRDDYLSLLTPVYDGLSFFPAQPVGFEGDFVSTDMNAWIDREQENSRRLIDAAALLRGLAAPQPTLLTSGNTLESLFVKKPWTWL